MTKKYTPAQIKHMCSRLTAIQTFFLVPVTIGGHKLTFKICYRHERGAYVAEPGFIERNHWTPTVIHAPLHQITDIRHTFKETFGVLHIAGINVTGAPNIMDTICRRQPKQ